MNRLLLESARKELSNLTEYVNKCNFDELTLYRKTANTFSQLGALFNNFIKDPKTKEDELKNACIAFNNAFKHCAEMKRDYTDLKMLEYGPTLEFILPVPLGDVVVFRNADYLKELKDIHNYNWYAKVLDGKRMDLILYEIKKIVGEIK